ncbi:MAG: hypothetical protein GC190_11485 [Alphaproteobacteria bacterium]|nr:hypothetical protein [Alphaproteobacteria bacterium]
MLRRLRVLFSEFAALILFWAVYWPFGIKAAIGAVVLYVIADAVRRHFQHQDFTRLYVLTTVLTVVFGAIDLVSQTPFMIQYEAVITNTVIGTGFVFGALGDRPLLQNAAEDWTGTAFPHRPDFHRFFVLFTLFWAAYFFVKAALYLWIGLTYPMEEALAIRTAISIPSLIGMVAISTQGRYLFFLCRYLGLIPPPPSEAEDPQGEAEDPEEVEAEPSAPTA